MLRHRTLVKNSNSAPGGHTRPEPVSHARYMHHGRYTTRHRAGRTQGATPGPWSRTWLVQISSAGRDGNTILSFAVSTGGSTRWTWTALSDNRTRKNRHTPGDSSVSRRRARNHD